MFGASDDGTWRALGAVAALVGFGLVRQAGSRAIPGPYARGGGLASFNRAPGSRFKIPEIHLPPTKKGSCPAASARKPGTKNPEIGISFHGLSKKKLDHLFAAEAELLKAGIGFDTGYGFQGDGVRDWEWDWSLSGPVTITVKNPGRKGKGSRTRAPVSLGDMAEVGLDLRNADVWIPRKGRAKGEPTRTFDADHVGIRVTRKDVLLPEYVRYALQYLAMQGFWATQPVSVANVKAIQFQPTA